MDKVIKFDIDNNWHALLKKDLCVACRNKLTTLEDNHNELIRMCKHCGNLYNDKKEEKKNE